MKKLQIAIILAALAFAVPAMQADEAKAKANFEKYCAGCHGKDGKGETPLGKRLEARDFSDAKVLQTIKEADMFKAVKEGLKKGDKVLMKPYNDKMTDAEIKEVVAYMRTFAKK